MRFRMLWAAVFMAACFSSVDPPADRDAAVPCPDEDEDGVCAADDCDDGDPARAESCDDPCAADPEQEGCPCASDGDETASCFDGDPAMAGIGVCNLGVRTCHDARWTDCQGSGSAHDETCNGADDDCDGAIDDGVQSTCGDCDVNCHRACVGVGCEAPFAPGPGGSVDAEGALVVTGDPDLMPHVLWLGSRFGGTVARVDTTTLTLGPRYSLVAENSSGIMGSVVMDGQGDGYVTLNGLLTDVLVAKVSASPGRCEDRDGDGQVRTSGSFGEVLPFGEDECVAWVTEIDCGGCIDPGVIALTAAGTRAWAGGPLLELDTADGRPTGRRIENGGAALVAEGASTLWALGYGGVDSIDLDDLSVERVTDDGREGRTRIDLDSRGRVWWLSGDRGDQGISYYDADEEDVVTFHLRMLDFGIVDDTTAWALSPDRGDQALLKLDLARFDVQVIPTPGRWARGLVVDLDGHVWAGDSDDSQLTAYDVVDGTEVVTFAAADLCPNGEDGSHCTLPSLLGDPTGVRFRRAFGTEGTDTTMTHVFDTTCDDYAELTLSWEAGAGTVSLSVRAAPFEEAFPAAIAVAVGASPPAAGTVNLLTAFQHEGRTLYPLIEVTALLQGGGTILRRVELLARCNP